MFNALSFEQTVGLDMDEELWNVQVSSQMMAHLSRLLTIITRKYSLSVQAFQSYSLEGSGENKSKRFQDFIR
jgi:hypothetical protein